MWVNLFPTTTRAFFLLGLGLGGPRKASAIKAVVDDGMSIRGAAEYYGVPKSTLGDRISGHVLPGA